MRKPCYHIDYVVVSSDLASRIRSVEVGSTKIWSPLVTATTCQ